MRCVFISFAASLGRVKGDTKLNSLRPPGALYAMQTDA